MRKKSIVIAIILCLVLLLANCGKGTDKNVQDIPTTGDNLNTNPSETVVPEPTQNQTLCSLTGLQMEANTPDIRPVAVMIDNMASARPQSGLINADIVYEMPAEGGITRYMAIYHHQSSDKIGPVRSARSYYIDKAMEFNAVYVHCGGSPEALGDIQTLKIDSLNELKGESNFWRSKDRKAPHNLYTSTKLINEVMESKKISQEKWDYKMNFSDNYIDLQGKAIKGIVIDYKHNYKAGYEYDGNQKLFFRTINGVRLKDKETNVEVSTVNIIIEKVKSKIVDDIGRIDITNVGTGRGYFITGGKLIEIEWSKGARNAKTTYKDLKGNPIQLNKGNTWIQVIPDYGTLDIKE
ncbi:MAG: hypothetical protein K0S75_753 [Clostridia bacterium]|jgi:hypothetical protein|nr:hypothetical protein [Clostridia bacterium]